jgi:AcrR family transcriptional regulator
VDHDVEVPAPARPGRPRSTEADQAILDATVQLLIRDGYQALSFDAVAARAGVGKRTIYRRWRSKGALVSAAYLQKVERDHPDPDTGDTAKDLRLLLRRLFTSIREPAASAALRSMAAEAQLDADFAVELQKFIQARRSIVRTILERGVQRGQIRADADLSTLVDMVFGPFWYRLLFAHAPLDARFATSLVDHVLRGAQRQECPTQP